MPEIEVREVPRGNQRHRTVGGHQYTPTATLEARRQIRMAWLEAGFPLFGGPVCVRVSAFMPRPRAHFGTGKNAERPRRSAPRLPTGKPDVDNLLKLVGDALAGVAFGDDAAIVQAFVDKGYAGAPGEPEHAGWRISVEPWRDE
jgi:Holliday junction resolvase RusA-like endonuclease